MYENTFTEIASVIVTYNDNDSVTLVTKYMLIMRVDDNRGGAISVNNKMLLKRFCGYRIMVITGGFQPFDVSSILSTRSNM